MSKYKIKPDEYYRQKYGVSLNDSGNSVKANECMLAELGNYRFAVPTGCTGLWTLRDWFNYVIGE